MIVIPEYTYTIVPLGLTREGKPGDFFLCHRSHFFSKIISWGEHLRSKTRPYSYWNHAGVFLGNGKVAEALTKGVVTTDISVYESIPYAIVGLEIDDHDREQILDYVHYAIGSEYDFAVIASIIINIITGSTVSLGVDGHQICSGLVASSILRAGAILDKGADHVTPADLAKYFNLHQTLKRFEKQ